MGRREHDHIRRVDRAVHTVWVHDDRSTGRIERSGGHWIRRLSSVSMGRENTE